MEEEDHKKEDEIERAERIKNELKAENDRREKLINDEKEMKAKSILSGSSNYNEPQTPKPLTPKEYRQDVERRIAQGEFDKPKEDFD